MNNDSSHVLLVTFPGQGHINPSFQLAKRLVKMGLKVTFLTAKYALDRMLKTSPLPPHLHDLTFLPFSDGLEEGAKLGRSVDEMMDELKRRGIEEVEEIIKSSIENGKPFTRVIYTVLLPWVARIARSLKVPSTFFWIQPATLLDIYYYYFDGYGEAFGNDENDPLWSIELPGLPRLTTRDLPSFLTDSCSFNFTLPLFKDHIDVLRVEENPKVLVNTFEELEYEALSVVKDFNFVPIGPLIPSAFLDGKDPTDNSFGADLLENSNNYIEWLNTKEKGSVIYVAFGSYAELPEQQMIEIAKGLIETERPFLWVIRRNRKSDGSEKKEEINNYKGYFGEELDEKRGKIVEWCSQVEVLSHSSLGCFVTHCGWNSTLEGLVCGVPLVCFPLLSDQTTNAKLVEDVWEVGVRVELNNIEGSNVVEGSEIKRCIEIVMKDGEKGNERRRNCVKWKGLAREAAKEGGSSDLNLKDFVDHEIRGHVVRG